MCWVSHFELKVHIYKKHWRSQPSFYCRFYAWCCLLMLIYLFYTLPYTSNIQMYRIICDTIPFLFDFLCFIGRKCFLNHTIRKKLGDMGDVQIHPMLPGDVILGAKNLANHLPLAMPASSPASWEWRAFAEGQNTSNHWQRCHKISSLQVKLFCYFYVLCLCGCSCFQAIRWLQISVTHGPRVHIHSAGQWYRLPAYISAVFEGALRNGKPLASVQLTGRLGMYLVANLEDWRSYGRILKGGCFFSSSLLIMFLLLHASTM